ncbi:hypothetical protein PIB30_067928 [Stylosanthes scabra]|uniref:Uncharacterized protein n=1 Tax=Stylosanthes scabra TaxID=79078 RepID=A0ABU6TPC3_9FABA|nr:hypothetical protein [Stylosanthes scabra]
MDRMDDQLSFLCYSNQMANEQMLFPYQNTSRQFKEMEMQGILVTMANLAIHRQREEEMNQERMRVYKTPQSRIHEEKAKKEGFLLAELLAGCTRTSKAAHTALKLRKQLTSNTEAAHATHRSCARSFLAPAKLLTQQMMVHTPLNLKARSGISSLWT